MSDLILSSRDCPPEMWPKQVRSLVAIAEATGWVCDVKIALLSDVRVVAFFSRRGPVRTSARFEGDTNGVKMAFVSAWRTPGALGWPDRLGFRELSTYLKMPDPRTQLTASGVA